MNMVVLCRYLNKWFFAIFIVRLVSSCNFHKSERFNGVLSDGANVEYNHIENVGYAINVQKIELMYTLHFTISLKKDGSILNIVKYDDKYYNKMAGIDVFRTAKFLVNDTAGKYGPSLNGESINGYYTDTFLINNVIYCSKSKHEISALTNNEKLMFHQIETFMNAHNKKIQSLDSIGKIFWYSYIF